MPGERASYMVGSLCSAELSSSSIGIDPDPNPSSASSTASRTQSIRRRLRHRLRHGIASSAEVTASAQHRLSLQRPSHRLSFDRVTLAYCCTSQVQYSDLAEVDRASILEKFRQSTSEWSQNINVLPGDCTESGNGDHNCAMIVVTDACLPSVVPGEAPVSAHILINYELPTKKLLFLALPSLGGTGRDGMEKLYREREERKNILEGIGPLIIGFVGQAQWADALSYRDWNK
ncbi:uncharacterized protein A4U43_C03F19230 [Asparagus officinalis]|uniref:Uncharacterized protein n=1 Tax=Asparagus officinalis TaxID=4686 RepID=A0A5P1FC42_ASPOF|nr:uncharacterized protein A4U43_C03F19230 [Asparagus officinalis]